MDLSERAIMDYVENPILRAHRLGLDDGIAGKTARCQQDFSYVGWIAYCRGYRQGESEARAARVTLGALRRKERAEKKRAL